MCVVEQEDECYSFACDSKRASLSFGAADRVHLRLRSAEPSIYTAIALPPTSSSAAATATAASASSSPQTQQLGAVMYVSEHGSVYVWGAPSEPPKSGASSAAASTALVPAAIAPAKTFELPLAAQETVTKVGRAHVSVVVGISVM